MTIVNDSLNHIIESCKKGDSQGFSQLIDMYSGRCYGYYYRLTGNRDLSDELLSELFVKLVEKIKSYNGGSFESWLFKIASNIFHDYLRAKQRRKKLIDTKKELLEAEITEEKTSGNEQIDKLQINLKKLDPETVELIMLRFYSQLSFKEIAELRSEPIGTTLAKLHRGVKKLRKFMEG